MRRRPWLIGLAVLFFALAAYLMSRGEEPEKTESAKDKIRLPTRMTDEERGRLASRQITLAEVDAGVVIDRSVRVRDPVLAAIPATDGGLALMLEANAVRYSPVGELLIDCLAKRGALEDFKNEAGIDLTKDIDRIGVWNHGVMASGNLQSIAGRKGFEYGKHYGDATLFKEGEDGVIRLPDGGSKYDPETTALWRGQMLLYADDEEEAKRMIDRLEGRESMVDHPPALDDSLAYGEMYGVIPPELIAKLIPDDQKAARDLLLQGASRIELHADTQSGIGIVADIKGENEATATDLAKTLAGTLTIARLKAQMEKDDDLAQILELAKVDPDGRGRFRLELGVPMRLIEDRLAWCRDQKDAGQ